MRRAEPDDAQLPSPQRAGRVPARPVGRDPRRGAPARQGLPHRGAALAQPGGRSRPGGAARARAGVRRGQGARAGRRCGGSRDARANSVASPPRPPHGSRATRTMPTATSASTPCWSRRGASRTTSRRRSTQVNFPDIAAWRGPKGPAHSASHSVRDPHEPQRRRADGPDRADQHPRRFHVRAPARGAGARACARLLHARPLAQRDGRVFATVRPLRVRDVVGDHFTLGEPKRVELAHVRRDPDAPGPAVRPRLHLGDAPARAHPSADTWWSTTRRTCATRPRRCSSPNSPT